MVGNLAEGILYEISRDAVIRYNQVYRNGSEGKGWHWLPVNYTRLP